MSTKPKFSSLELPKPNEKDLDRYVETRGAPVLTPPKSSAPRPDPVVKKHAADAVIERRPQSERQPLNRSQRTHSIRTEVPDYLAKALRLKAAERDCTIRYLLLEALQAQGFVIDAGDLTEDGRRTPTSPSAAEIAK